MARFKVVGNHTVEGVAPGGHVNLPDGRRARLLVRAGHLEVAARPAGKAADSRKDD